MKYSAVFSALSLTSFVYALPAKRDGALTADVLNFALNLEHLENAFYEHVVSTYQPHDFETAGHPQWVRGRLEQVAQHEKTHVEFLTSALTAAGAKPAQACKYEFPCHDVNSCLALANIFETLGTSAYTGAIGSVSEGDYAIAAGSILAIEARHSAWIGSAVHKSFPWSTAFETALTPNQVITMASAVIKECPVDNPRLIATPFPQLTISNAAPGKPAKLSFQSAKDSGNGKPLFVAFLTGSKTLFVPLSQNREVTVPEGLFGTVFVILTNDGGKVTDETTVAGPTIVMLPYSSSD